MNIHKNARLTPKGRALLVQRILEGDAPEDAAAASGVSLRTARRWLKRYRDEGEAGLLDRSSRPPGMTPQANRLWKNSRKPLTLSFQWRLRPK